MRGPALTNPPQNTSLHDALQEYVKTVVVIIHTTEYEEWLVVQENMDAPKLESVKEKQERPLILTLNADTELVLGEFCGYSAALITALSPTEFTQFEEALPCLSSARCILSIGALFAITKKNQKLCDVVVSDCIDGIHEINKPGDTKLVKFGLHDTRFTPVSQSLINVFQPDNSWEGFDCTKQRGRKSKVSTGIIISMPYEIFAKCYDFMDKVLELPCNESTYLGLEMAGTPILQIIDQLKAKNNHKMDVILIKGIRAYVGDLRRDKDIWKWQITACMAAIDYAKHKLEHSSEMKKYLTGKFISIIVYLSDHLSIRNGGSVETV